jgi:hypothetical protein
VFALSGLDDSRWVPLAKPTESFWEELTYPTFSSLPLVDQMPRMFCMSPVGRVPNRKAMRNTTMLLDTLRDRPPACPLARTILNE